MPSVPTSNTGVFDELVAGIADTVHPADRKSFIKAFNPFQFTCSSWVWQENGLVQGQAILRRAYRLIQTDVIFVQSSGTEDVLELTMAREVGTIDKDG